MFNRLNISIIASTKIWTEKGIRLLYVAQRETRLRSIFCIGGPIVSRRYLSEPVFTENTQRTLIKLHVKMYIIFCYFPSQLYVQLILHDALPHMKPFQSSKYSLHRFGPTVTSISCEPFQYNPRQRKQSHRSHKLVNNMNCSLSLSQGCNILSLMLLF